VRERATDRTDDDMRPACADAGWNLGFRIHRRTGIPAPSGSVVAATCELSQNKALDCPGLAG